MVFISPKLISPFPVVPIMELDKWYLKYIPERKDSTSKLSRTLLKGKSRKWWYQRLALMMKLQISQECGNRTEKDTLTNGSQGEICWHVQGILVHIWVACEMTGWRIDFKNQLESGYLYVKMKNWIPTSRHVQRLILDGLRSQI